MIGALKKGIFEFADTASLGLVPESWDPGATTPGEEFAGNIGGLLGLVGPAAVGYGAGRGMKSLVSRGVPAASEIGDAAKKLRSLYMRMRTTKDPRLKKFYSLAFRKAYGALVAGPRVGLRAAEPVFKHLRKYPTATGIGTGIATGVMAHDLFNPSDYYSPVDEYETEE